VVNFETNGQSESPRAHVVSTINGRVRLTDSNTVN